MGLLDRLFGIAKSAQSAKQKPSAAPAKPAAPKPTAPAGGAEKKPAPGAVKPQPNPAEEKKKAPETEKPVPAAVQPAPEPETTGSALPTAFEEGLQKRLDTYFARLRQEFPGGEIRRLNTGHKKLAERGAELRRLTGYEGKLDEFFALGGFTYCRSAGGRPSLPAEVTDSVEDRLRVQFPEDVPTVLAVKQADPRLYLDLRAAARKQGRTAGEYLQQFKEV